MSNNQQQLLTMQDVRREYGRAPNQVVALAGVNFTIAKGEMVAIMGPSGSGKSTLMTIAGGLESPTAGTVHLDGVNIWEASPVELAKIRRRQVGFVFQDFNLLSGLTAAENVSAPKELDGQSAKAAQAEAVERLDQVGLGDRAGAFPDDLSGGERQRVAIARALIGERRLLLADEPTGALDSATSTEIMQLLRDACDSNSAVVVVTHDPKTAAWADRIVRLRDGQIENDGLLIHEPKSDVAEDNGVTRATS